jgi:hypothetical protein
MPYTEAVKQQLRALGYSDEQIAQMEASGASSPTGPTGPAAVKKPTTTRYPSEYSITQAKSFVIDYFKKYLKREPTADELKKWRTLLVEAQRKNPSTQTYDPKTRTQSTVGGLDEAQWLFEELNKDPVYAEELKKIKLTSGDVLQRQLNKQLYVDAVKAAAGDESKIFQLNRTTDYGLAISGLKDRIKLSAERAGATLDDAAVDQLAQEAYDNNQDADPYTFQNFLNSKFKFSVPSLTGLKGEAADNINTLKKVAIANGLDLQKAFGSQLPLWLEALNRGGNIEDFKQMIRSVAKIGMPEKIAKLIDQGIDLDTIYSPYQNLMENILELPSGSITLDDPTLRSAITTEGEMPLYQFERNLRQDKRWQFTNSAREEVSSAVSKVLRDFGFQG